MSELRDRIINGIIDREGGYVNDHDDAGGETNFGITRGAAKRYGYIGEMVNLTKEIAFDIYVNRYWNALNLMEIERASPRIAEELADTAVNMGVSRAGEFLQRALNAFNNKEILYADIKVDGDVGPRTLVAFMTYRSIRKENGAVVLHRALNALQGAFYIDLVERRQKDEKFIFGWFSNRVE